MENQLMLSGMVKQMQELLEKHGDCGVYHEDMKPMTGDDIEVVDAHQPEKHGKKFVHIGSW